MHSEEPRDLINQLAEELTPVPRLPSPFVRSVSWLLPAFLIVLLVMWYVQPFRPGFVVQLTAVPRFSLEIFFGYATGILAIITGFFMAIPGAKEQKMMKRLTILSLVAWATLFFWSYLSPSLEASMTGKREACVYETALYGLLLAAALVLFHRRSAFSNSGSAAFSIGIGCGFIPAVTMQLACMYIPPHGLTHHFMPVTAITIMMFYVGRKFLPRI